MDELSNQAAWAQEQELGDNEEPPDPFPRPARPWRVAVIANVKGESTIPVDSPEDAGAEFDRKETIQAIQTAIESDGHSSIFLHADATLPLKLQETCPDICFNISEGQGGDAREAQVPALMEMLHIPYTASRVLANALGLDKVMTKKIWHEAGLPTARYQEFTAADEPLAPALAFPMFVKPAREGTGMGMDEHSIVHNESELRSRVAWVLEEYRQPALVEEYLSGREFTVVVMGRPDARLYTRHPEWYAADGFHRAPVLEVDNTHSGTPGVYGHYMKSLDLDHEEVSRFYCPADIPDSLRVQMQEMAIQAHKALGALDISRVDFRLNGAGEPNLLEINTLPGMTPDFSDMCMIFKREGISYRELVLEILYLGASRFGLLQPRGSRQMEPIPVREFVTITK